MEFLKVTIFDINNKTFEERIITLNEFLKVNTLLKENKLLKLSGLEILGQDFDIFDSKRFMISLLSFLYKDYEIINRDRFELGCPDFLLKKGNDELYIEMKLSEDGLRCSQLKWILENSNKKSKIIWVNITNSSLIVSSSKSNSNNFY